MKISDLLSKAKVAEVSGTAATIVYAYNENPIADDAILATAITELDDANNELITALEKDRALSQLEDYDQPRDEAYRALNNYVKGMLSNPIQEARTTAEALHKILTKYKGLDRFAYTQETAQMKSLIEDWEKLGVDAAPEYQALYNTLVEAQASFQKAYDQYLEALKDSKATDSATKIKPTVLNKINDRLLLYLRSATEFQPKIYNDFATKVQIAIDKTNENVKERTN